MNKLGKIKSTLRSGELCKPITDHKSSVENRNIIKILVSMIELAYCLSYKEDDHTTAIMFIDAQLEKFNSQAVFGREQDRLELIRILHAACVDAGAGKDLDLELFLNQIRDIFKPDEEATENDESLQAALSAQVRRLNYENRGMAAHHRNVPKKNQDTRSPKPSPADLSKLVQVAYNMKAEMGCMRTAMTNAGISFEKSSSGPKPREQSANGKQKNKFAGTAKMKNKANKDEQRSLVNVPEKTAVSDSDDEPQLEHGYVTSVAKPKKKHVSPRAMNAMLVGITKHRDPEMRRISEREASVPRNWAATSSTPKRR